MAFSIEHDVHQLAQNGDQLAHIQASLQALTLDYQHLLDENAKLRSNIAAKQVPDAPMRTLMPELCGLIFFHVCSPLALSHVCRRWREMVLGNPLLWRDLHIDLANPRLALIPLWFRHADPLSINVTVRPGAITPPVANPFKKADPEGIRDLVPYLHRIHGLFLRVHQPALGTLFPKGTLSRMVSLERLSVEHHGYILDESEIGGLVAPALRDLRLSDPSPLLNLLANSLSQVKALHLNRVEFWEYPRKVPEFLSHCSQLQDLSLAFPRNVYLAGADVVTLPCVTHLSLEWCFPSNPIPIFSAILAPRLRCLSLAHTNHLNTFSQDTVTTLQNLIQSSPLLTTLKLESCNLASICEMSSIFFHAPALEELSLSNCHGIGRLLYDLTPADWERPSTWLCPNLERISVDGIRDNDVRALINFVRRRMEPTDSTLADPGHYIKELALDSRLQDFSTQGRLLILRGLSVITPSVNIVGPLERVNLSSPFSSPVPKN